MSRLTGHPGDVQLALFAGQDLGYWERWRVARHVSGCGPCAREIQALQSARERVRDLTGQLPEGVNWPRLHQEMTGNIRVGLAAGECVAGFEKSPGLKKPGLVSHAAWVLACATVVVAAALWIELPSLQRIRFERIGKVVTGAPLLASDVVLEASPLSIGIRENGGTLSLLHPRSDAVAVSVSMQGSAGLRYIDADTDQVTTNRVYYAQ